MIWSAPTGSSVPSELAHSPSSNAVGQLRDGHLSLAAWMVARQGVARSTAAGHVRMARALEQMRVTAEALAAGEVSSAAVSLLASAQEMERRFTVEMNERPRFFRADGTVLDRGG